MRDGTPVGEVGGKLAPLRHCSTDDGGGCRAEDEAKEPAGVVDGGDVDQAEEPCVQSRERIPITVGDHVTTKPEHQSSEERVQDVLDENVGRILRSNRPRLQESEAGLQEEHNKAVDENEESVDSLPNLLHLVFHGRS